MHLFVIAGVLLEIHSIQAFPDLSQILRCCIFLSQIILHYPNPKCPYIGMIILHYLDVNSLYVGILFLNHLYLKSHSLSIIIVHYLNQKCHSVAIINSLSLSEMPLCWHHYLALSQPRSNFAPRGRITPMGGLPYKASILNHN